MTLQVGSPLPRLLHGDSTSESSVPSFRAMYGATCSVFYACELLHIQRVSAVTYEMAHPEQNDMRYIEAKATSDAASPSQAIKAVMKTYNDVCSKLVVNTCHLPHTMDASVLEMVISETTEKFPWCPCRLQAYRHDHRPSQEVFFVGPEYPAKCAFKAFKVATGLKDSRGGHSTRRHSQEAQHGDRHYRR